MFNGQRQSHHRAAGTGHTHFNASPKEYTTMPLKLVANSMGGLSSSQKDLDPTCQPVPQCSYHTPPLLSVAVQHMGPLIPLASKLATASGTSGLLDQGFGEGYLGLRQVWTSVSVCCSQLSSSSPSGWPL